MIFIKQLYTQDFRNLKNNLLECSPFFNVFSGPNGAGKTSLLEAVHLLGLSQSFRLVNLDHAIAHGARQATVLARIQQGEQCSDMRWSKHLARTPETFWDDQPIPNRALQAEYLPLHLIHPESFELILKGPDARRAFMDKGLFHVEPSFLVQWRRLKRCLQQRRELLRAPVLDRQALRVWDRELVEVAEPLNQIREYFVFRFHQHLKSVMNEMEINIPVNAVYEPGWNVKVPLSAMLEQHYEKDRSLGYTSAGPHRWDIRLVCPEKNDWLAKDVLSRGQQKMLVLSAALAMGTLLHTSRSHAGVFLMDDIYAELDAFHRQRVNELFLQMKAQVLLTTLEENAQINIVPKDKICYFRVLEGQTVKGGE